MIVEEALLRTVGRRKRYPKKASTILEMVYKKNRKSLKELRVVSEKRKVELNIVVTDNDNLAEDCERVMKKLKTSQDNVLETKNKAGRLVEAFKIMKNVEAASKADDKVMGSK